MEKRTKNTGLVLMSALVFLIGAAALFTVNNPSRIVHNPTPTIIVEKKAPLEKPEAENVSYQGEEGKDALTLLKDRVKVEQNSSGLVTSIKGYLADEKEKEFWAFYVNGKMAEVGPAEYITKNEDKIEWKIENY